MTIATYPVPLPPAILVLPCRNCMLMTQRFYTKIDTPCTANWESMAGDDQVRFCQLCKLNVYNLTEMTDDEVDQLSIERPAERRCVRLMRRADGSTMTANCPKYFRKARTLLLKRAPWILVLLSSLAAPPSANAQGSPGYVQLPPSQNSHFTMGPSPSIGPNECWDPSGVNPSDRPATWEMLAVPKVLAVSLAGTLLLVWRNRFARRKTLAALRAGACARDVSSWLQGWHVGFAIGAALWLLAIVSLFTVWLIHHNFP
jgi:hypothetical protein